MEITPGDLFLPDLDSAGTGRAVQMISTVMARAARFAPCVLTNPDVETAAKGILVDVIARRLQALQLVPGVAQSKTLGDRSLSTDTRGAPTALFFPTEIAELQSLCADAAAAATTPVYSFPEAQPWPDGLCPPRVRWL